jgi:hypothetical protein
MNVTCPNCKKSTHAGEDPVSGIIVTCRHCDHRFVLGDGVAPIGQRPASADEPAGAPSLQRRSLVALAFAASIVPLAFAVYADPLWEDSFITLRHVDNLLNGEGLTYAAGERIQGFSSPLAVLLMAFSSFVTGQLSFVYTFWIYRLLCIAASAVALTLVARRLWNETPAHPLICAGGFVLLYAFDPKVVTFTTSGMETAFMLLFLAGAVSLLVKDDPAPWLARGLYWGGLMWGRVDGCIYIAALAIADLVFRSG